MIVVSDTTPIISLLKIGHLDLLKELFSEIIIPDSVHTELTQKPEYEKEAKAVNESPYISTRTATNEEAIAILQQAAGLDIGEAEAIALAREIGAELLLIDEKRGREVAKNLKIEITGTIGILKSAKELNLLTQNEIEECIDDLKRKGQFHSERLYEILLKD